VPLYLLVDWIQGSARSAIEAVVWEVTPAWAFVAYRVLMHGRRGQTVGKMATRLKVYDISGRILSMRQAVLRESGLILLNLTWTILYLLTAEDFWAYLKADIPGAVQAPGWLATSFWIGIGWNLLNASAMFLNKKRRAIHDFIAGSVVVRLEPQAADPSAEKVRTTVVHATRVLLVLGALAAIYFFLRSCGAAT
jgi:uncharacterized RDD family membrane protein YckC